MTSQPSIETINKTINHGRVIMQKIAMVSRYLLGLIYFVFGLNGFLNFIPVPKDAFPEAAMQFMTGLMGSGYFFPFLKGTEVVCGLLLLAGLWCPLALIILAPITINIILFHGILTPGMQNCYAYCNSCLALACGKPIQQNL